MHLTFVFIVEVQVIVVPVVLRERRTETTSKPQQFNISVSAFQTSAFKVTQNWNVKVEGLNSMLKASYLRLSH